MTAQGNALGQRFFDTQALKGRNNSMVFRPFRAGKNFALSPGALPLAIVSCPFRALREVALFHCVVAHPFNF